VELICVGKTESDINLWASILSKLVSCSPLGAGVGGVAGAWFTHLGQCGWCVIYIGRPVGRCVVYTLRPVRPVCRQCVVYMDRGAPYSKYTLYKVPVTEGTHSVDFQFCSFLGIGLVARLGSVLVLLFGSIFLSMV